MVPLHCVEVVSVPLIHRLWHLVIVLHMSEPPWKPSKSVNGNSLVILSVDPPRIFVSRLSILKVIVRSRSCKDLLRVLEQKVDHDHDEQEYQKYAKQDRKQHHTTTWQAADKY